MATSTGSDDEIRNRPQQSPLASQRARANGEVRHKGWFEQWFPLTAKEGFNQWWSALAPATAEHRVLSFIPYLQKPPTHTQTGSAPVSTTGSSVDLPAGERHAEEHITTSSITDPYGPRRWNSEMVELSGRNRALNEFSVERVGEQVDQNLVMLHGYGAGLGFFYKNYEALSRAPGWKIYSLDLLGMGRSSRPSFRIHAKDKEGKITEAENWFIDALEEWRIKRNIDRFTLLGHSLGGYLATAYALKYPGHLNKLVLASPVGIPEDPDAVNDAVPDPEDSTMINEFSQDQSETTKPADNNNFMNQRSKNAKPEASKPRRRRLPAWLVYLWEANMISPFSFVRWSGPLGPRLVSGWTSRRFSQMPPEEAQALHDYSYSLFRQRGSSEYALAVLLAPGAFARSPLIRRIQGVGRQYVSPHTAPIPDSTSDPKCLRKHRSKSPAPSVAASQISQDPSEPPQRENGIPVVFMYGSEDWMDVAGGFASEEKMKEEKAKILKDATPEERSRDNGDAKVVIIKKAGHHVYLDGWKQFNDVMLEEMRDTARRESRQGRSR